VTLTGGEDSSIRVPFEAVQALWSLRADMATPQGGAWYFTRFTFSREGNYRAVFDYDSRPRWESALDPEYEREMILEDLERYPRSEAATPNWLRELRS
jgi:hypothetical protein